MVCVCNVACERDKNTAENSDQLHYFACVAGSLFTVNREGDRESKKRNYVSTLFFIHSESNILFEKYSRTI